MADLWYALGRGFIKLLVTLFAGFGVGLLVIGWYAQGEPTFWEGRNPPGGLFVGIGAGLLTTALLLVVLFIIPRRGRKLWPPCEPREGGERIDPEVVADQPREHGDSRHHVKPM